MVSSSLTKAATYSFTTQLSKLKASRLLKKVKQLSSTSSKALADHKRLT